MAINVTRKNAAKKQNKEKQLADKHNLLMQIQAELTALSDKLKAKSDGLAKREKELPLKTFSNAIIDIELSSWAW